MEQVLSYFTQGFAALSWQQVVMYGIGGILIWLAIAKEYEPMLLLPIGFGAILVNLPLEIVWEHDGVAGALKILFEAGILTELFPLLVFIAVDACFWYCCSQWYFYRSFYCPCNGIYGTGSCKHRRYRCC